jgi:hypothetical protein
VRRNGSYLFVRRFPTQYVERGIFKQPTYRKALGTKDRLTAEKRVRHLAARFDVVMDWLAERDKTQVNAGVCSGISRGRAVCGM